jgi:hypothetical protein
MRRYDIVSGIFLILSIIDFALAAPVLVQEKRQASVTAAHIPKELITLLGKRWEEDLVKPWEKYYETLVDSEEPSATLTLSTNVGQPPAPDPAPDPASSTANPYPYIRPPSPASTVSTSWEDRYFEMFHHVSDLSDNDLHGLLYTPTSSGYGDDELHGPLYTSTASSGYSSDHEFTKAHEPQPNANSRPSTEPDSESSTQPDFDWNYWMNSEDPPPQGPVSPKEFGQAHAYYPDPPSTSGYAPGPPPTMPEPKHELETPPPSNLGSPKEPEEEVAPRPATSPHLDDQSLSADTQPVDLQAAIYAVKGKAKESRRISGTPRDVGNHAAQRDLQPAERSLDPGE